MPSIANRYRKGVLWSPSYFVSSCGGAPLSIIRQYVENQRTPAQCGRTVALKRRGPLSQQFALTVTLLIFRDTVN